MKERRRTFALLRMTDWLNTCHPEQSEGLPLEGIGTTLAIIANAVVSRRLAAPAKLFLEMNKPLTGVLYNMSLISAPLVLAIFGSRFQKNLESVLESSENVEQLIQMIEERENYPQ